MAQRNETSLRKLTLLNDLRAAHQRGDGDRQETPLSQRELSARYSLSGQTISALLQQLMQEGVLYTVPRVGTFLGRHTSETPRIFLFVTEVPDAGYSNVTYIEAMHIGFADRIAQLGGSIHNLSVEEMSRHLEAGNLTNIAGAAFFAVPRANAKLLIEQIGAPAVIDGELREDFLKDALVDSVEFDDREGGMQATRHLMGLGHRNIAFLGLHAPGHSELEFAWSLRRMAGWNQVIRETGLNPSTLGFLPEFTSSTAHGAQKATASILAERMIEPIRREEISAVVAVNAIAAQGLIQTLRASFLPRESWPAIVCFDDAPQNQISGVSYLRLPWEKKGAEAAQLLWERQLSPDQRQPRHRLVKMHLIPRLTCRPDWANSGLVPTDVLPAALPGKVNLPTPNPLTV